MSVPPDTLGDVVHAPTRRNPLGAGRNPRAGAPSTTFALRLADDERKRYQAAADAAELTLAEWIRAACEARLNKRRTR